MEATGLIQILQLFYFFSVLFEITFCSVDVSIRVGKQGPFTYGNFHKRINGSVLRRVGSLISALEVDSDIECASSCVMNKLCLSVNFGSEANSTGKIQCELLNDGATDYHTYLVKKEKFFFMRMETICSKNPCVYDTLVCTPQLQDSYKPYICDCRMNCTGNINCYALGMEDGRILDSQITASSIFHNANWAAHKGRLHADSAWLARNQGEVQWIQVDLLNKTFIKGVATQGRNVGNQFIRTYQLWYSDDGTNGIIYREQGIEKTFKGNRDRVSVVTNMLAEPFTATIVRLISKLSHGIPSVRMELYGCPV